MQTVIALHTICTLFLLLDKNSKNSARNENVNMNIKNLGKIALKKGPAFSGGRVANITGAFKDTWKSMNPTIIALNKMEKSIIIEKTYKYFNSLE